ncbi:MAG: hypothetical protein GYB31_07805 [Bacteroidetes bacterium]|nr:hypothetical protein [Bacteroidota bacterium]
MKPAAYRFLTLCFFLSFFNLLNAQDYGPNGYYTFGLNAGWSYQSSDIPIDEDGYGLGLTLGRSLYYKYNAPLAVDIRGRFLFARQYGLDYERSFDITNNSVLNGNNNLNYLDYPNNLNVPEGFVFQNHQTTVGELSAELVFKFNRLRERTNFIFNIFGGIGLDLYNTRIDQANINNTEYYDAYANLDITRPRLQICDDLRLNVLDGIYETTADGFSGGPKLGIMPDAGVEIGWQFSPNFAILFGHRITFTGTDIFDGHQWAETDNDWYHYTSFGLEWTIPRKGRKDKPPKITILQPRQNPLYTQQSRPVISALIENVNSPAEVSANINGRQLDYDFFTEDFTAQPLLRAGRNEITITARNDAGMDRKKVIIFLEGGGPIVPPNPPPNPSGKGPIVKITSPSVSSVTVNDDNYTIRAEILGVNSKSEVKFSINGINERNFTFYEQTGQFTAAIRLKPGRNDIQIQAFNAKGSDQDNAVINYGQSGGDAPVVRFTSPSQNPYQTNSEAITVKAFVDNVSSRQNLTFLVNGRSNNTFSFNGTSFSATLRLSGGTNTLVLRGENAYGEAEDQVKIILGNDQNDFPLPDVDITKPAVASSSTQSQKATIVASIRHVNSRSNIKFKVNGKLVTNFKFSGETFSASVNLKQGNNTILIQAFNQKGSDEDEVTIKYSKPNVQNPPSVNITSPNNNTVTDQTRINMRAVTQNISRKDQIDLRVNGKRITNFNFQASRREITANINLSRGLNTISVSVTNQDGSDSDQVKVTHRPVAGPQVSISSPDNNEVFEQSGIQLVATVQNVDSKSGVRVELNGKTTNSFSFSGSKVTANLQLKSGVNVIKVTGTNAGGSDSDQVSVTLREVSVPKPVITFTNPKSPGTTTTNKPFSFQARIQHIDGKGDLTVRFNGRPIKNFDFSGRANILTVPVSLSNSGRNTLQVTATNDGGSTSESTYVIYSPKPDQQGNLPVVTITKITQPATNPMNPNFATSGVEAKVTGIRGSSQISILLNGEEVEEFNYNNRTKDLTFDLIIPRGSNSLKITATNSDGSDTAETTIDF